MTESSQNSAFPQNLKHIYRFDTKEREIQWKRKKRNKTLNSEVQTEPTKNSNTCRDAEILISGKKEGK